MNKTCGLLMGLTLLASCHMDKVDHLENDEMFTLLSSDITQVDFSNHIIEDNSFNFINYPYVYNGGGVSTGDFNNDGLTDLYFTANQSANKLYLNKGDFKFEEVTEAAGVADTEGWTTGTTVVDINNDGWLDIYVCKSGSLRNPKTRENLLYINQDGTHFVNQAEEWGLNSPGFSIQAYFMDYDKDGDMDMYLVNHRPDFENNAAVEPDFSAHANSPFTDQLYQNNGKAFVDVTQQAQVMNNAWGLSASIGDFNNDGWPDIYVCNDFLAPDFLYINNQKGGFQEQLSQTMGHISMNSMGSDYGDINNDGYSDFMVAEMCPGDHIRSKKNMPSMSTANFNALVSSNHHYQYMSNSLQLNGGNVTYSEIAQLSGVAKTDWSWAPLMADFDNDGFKDIFVTNGIIKDLSNSDFRNNLKSKIQKREKMSLEEALAMIPSEPLQNPIYQNNGDLTFSQRNADWNIKALSFSQGAATADLDNDGDLDLIVNNAQSEAFIYQNNADNNSLQIKLMGPGNNKLALGTKVEIYSNGMRQMQELYLSRGYQSSSSNILHFGLDSLELVDSILVTWPDGQHTVRHKVKANQVLKVDFSEGEFVDAQIAEQILLPLNKIETTDLGIDFVHQENVFDDFKQQLLLPYKLSQSGPFVTKADVNGDQLDDFFVGGAAGQSGQLYMQQASGVFELASGDWHDDEAYEDLGAVFFDIEGDGDLDLYVVSGGNEFAVGHELLLDRLYLNEAGVFNRSVASIPNLKVSGKIVVANDFDQDGDMDLFVGGRLVPGRYPEAPNSYFLRNDGGVMKEQTEVVAPGLSSLGMVTGAVFSDVDLDGDDDLLVVGEWNGIQLLQNENGVFRATNTPVLEHTRGLWSTINKYDIDGDGDDDYFLGNLGLNSKYKSTKGNEFHLYAADFDSTGTVDLVLSNKYKGELVPVRGRECSSEQMPFIKEKYPDYNSFAGASVEDIFGVQNLTAAKHLQVDLLESIMLINNGAAGFELLKLPNQAQVAPITAFDFVDLDDDGQVEILAVGNLYETEVETVRMDASKGSVLRWMEGELKAIPHRQTGFFIGGNTRSVTVLHTRAGGKYILVGHNDEGLDMFKIGQ
jgi:hypothetical protein